MHIIISFEEKTRVASVGVVSSYNKFNLFFLQFEKNTAKTNLLCIEYGNTK